MELAGLGCVSVAVSNGDWIFRCASISSSDDRDSLTQRLKIDSPSDPSDLLNGVEIDTEWTY